MISVGDWYEWLLVYLLPDCGRRAYQMRGTARGGFVSGEIASTFLKPIPSFRYPIRFLDMPQRAPTAKKYKLEIPQF
jgi:hypothetical protein